MITNAQQMADANANAKAIMSLALVGALAGAVAGPVVNFKLMPDAAQAVVTPGYIAHYSLARFAPSIADPIFVQRRAEVPHKLPEIHAALDRFPISVAAGAAAGAVVLPGLVAFLIALFRPTGKHKPEKRISPLDAPRR